MPIINSEIFMDLSDRLGKQVALIRSGIEAAAVTGGGEHYQRVTLSEDYNVEDDMIDDAYTLDKVLSGISMLGDISEFADVINDHNTHAVNRGASDLDDFLQTSGIDVADYYADLYYKVRGTRLSGRNVFYSDVLDPMATMVVVTSGTSTFTDGYALSAAGSGNYTGRESEGSLNTAAANLICYVSSGITIGAGGLGVSVTCTKESGDSESNTVTFSAGDIDGKQLIVGTTADKYIDVSNISLVTGSSGGDQVGVKSSPVRRLSL